MFKRVAKHIRKKEREEELGLDGDMKEMLGMNDVDSDSDSSSSDSDEDGSDEEIPTRDGAFAGADDSEDEEEESGSGEEGAGELEEDDDESDGEGSGEDGEMEGLDEEDESEEGDEDEPPLSVSEALQNPLYLVSLEPEVKACIVCPGKLIKNPIMAEVHLKSNAHTRRFGRLRETAMNVDADTDVRQVVRAALTPQTPRPTGAMSKRAQKKKAKLEAIKAKRAKQKIMKAKAKARKEAKAKAAASENGASGDEAETPSPRKPPAAKKRKVQKDEEEEALKVTAKKRKVKPAESKVEPPPKPAKQPKASLDDTAQVKAPTPTPAKPSAKVSRRPTEGLKTKKRRRSAVAS